jgi:hypothetical protein
LLILPEGPLLRVKRPQNQPEITNLKGRCQHKAVTHATLQARPTKHEAELGSIRAVQVPERQ